LGHRMGELAHYKKVQDVSGWLVALWFWTS
jgi:hypothetical protein